MQQFADIIAEQIGIRAQLICGKLPQEEVRDLRAKLTKKMDYLNHHLALDLVVRDQVGGPDNLELFYTRWWFQEGNILNSIPYRFFEELFNQLFDFIDSNNDGAMSLEDDFFVEMFHNARDRNGDGKMNLSEAFGVNLISLPAPIYNFYVKVTIFPKEISHDS